MVVSINVSFSAETWNAIVRGERTGLSSRFARVGLRFVSVPYGVGVWTRNRLFDRGWKSVHRVPSPVVSIGNLTLGGTGKTPCVEYVAGFYRDLGLQVAILSRGYGVEAGRNDEAMVLEENLPDVPHLQGANRVQLAMTAIEELESEILVLDDGFQHRRLHRDLDIVLVDATRPLHSERLFPGGTRREPIRELRRAGVLVLARVDQVSSESIADQREWLAKQCPQAVIVTATHAPRELVNATGETAVCEELRGKSVGAFCGIGNPTAFQRTLADLGANVQDFRVFPDHHAYSRADVEELRTWVNRLPNDAMIATTQKDFVKLRAPELGGRPLWAVRVGLRIVDGETALQNQLRAVSREPISTESK